MKAYFNTLSNQEILSSHEHCVTQPYLSNNYQVDLLLRNHNWAAGINTPATLSYKIVTDPSSDTYQEGYWNNEGKKLALSIGNLHDMLCKKALYKKILIDYIEDDNNRDAYQLYENNFPSSFAQTEYMLSTIFENIKFSIKSHPEHEELSWLSDVNSIYDIDLAKLNISQEPLNDQTEELFNRSGIPPTVSKEFSDQKFKLMIEYTFHAMSEVANITFQQVAEGEKVTIFASASEANAHYGKDDYFSLEEFDYSNGETNHVNLRGMYFVNSNTAFSNIDFSSSLHGMGHILIDHPNDSNIAIRDNLLPPDHDWSNRYEDYGVANEYRADNGCMSVMAFTECFYQGKPLKVINYMPIDIQALQHIYGKNENTRAGDTKYILTAQQIFVDDLDHSLFPMNVPNKSIYSLYDASGINTIDLSLVKEAKIDLNEGAGHFNVVGDNIFLISYGSHIHNVIVDSGDIEIKLNKELSNNIIIPSKGAHVIIENFIIGQDHITLDYNTNQNLEFSGCIRPYSDIDDNITEICFNNDGF